MSLQPASLQCGSVSSFEDSVNSLIDVLRRRLKSLSADRKAALIAEIQKMLKEVA